MADRSVVYRLEAQIGQFQSQMKAAGASVADAAGKMTAANKEGEAYRRSLTTLGDTAGRVGLVAAAGLGGAVKAAMDWESAWAGVMKTVDGSPEQMAALESELRGLARTLPATHDEIAGVAEAAGQLGVQRDAITDFTETMIALGETTNLSAEEAATSIAQMANVMQTAPQDVERLGAALVALGNDGASTERDIIFMAQRISAAGAQIGLVESDILAIANAAASMGVEVEAGGTAISRVFTELAKATASGGPKLEAFAEVAGMSVDEFSRLFRETPADAFAAFTSGLDRINKSGGDVFSTLKALGMSDVRVSQALLGMAASGDLLTDSLNLGREAWQENSALAEEFAKRLDTTASQVQTSWNNIKDAAIDAGAAMLPVVEGVAQTVATLAGAFQALPGPVKAAVGPMLGITAVLGGGLWFTAKTVNGVVEMRGALSELAGSSSKTAGMLGKVGKAATIAGAALAGMAVSDAILKLGYEAAPGVEELTKQLLDLADATNTDALSGQFEDLSKHIDRLTDKSWGTELNDTLSAAFGGILAGESWHEATRNIEGLDAALSSIASSAGAERAEAALRGLAEAAGLSDTEFEQLRSILPQYAEAVQGLENDSRLAEDATKDMSAAQAEAAVNVEALAKQQEQARKAANDQASAFFNLGDSLDDATVSLGEWIGEMEAQARALRNFRRNAEEAANKGLRQGLIRALQEAGPEGARRMEQLASATDQEIRRANRAWQAGQREIRAYVDETAKVPANKSTTLTVRDEASSRIQAIRNSIESLRDRNLTITTTHRVVRSSSDALPYRGHADGGFITGPGGPRDDLIPAYLSNGEYVIKAAAVEKYGRHMFDGLNAMRFADGGVVTRNRGDLGDSDLDRLRWIIRGDPGQRQMQKAERAAERQLKAAEELREAAKQQRDAAQQIHDAYEQQVAQSFNGDIFGNGLAGAMVQLEADRNDSREMRQVLKQLQAGGLSRSAFEALAASGDLTTASQLLAGGRSAIAQFSAAYNARAQEQAALGSYAANVVHPQAAIDKMGREIRQFNRYIRSLNGDIKALEKHIAGIGDRVERGARDGTRGGIRERDTSKRTRTKQRARAGK